MRCPIKSSRIKQNLTLKNALTVVRTFKMKVDGWWVFSDGKKVINAIKGDKDWLAVWQ